MLAQNNVTICHKCLKNSLHNLLGQKSSVDSWVSGLCIINGVQNIKVYTGKYIY